MKVEVVYALPERQEVIEVDVPAGATVRDAIDASGLAERFPLVDFTVAAIGIYGERAVLDDTLEPDDRVEVYRPLTADPKEARRRRARLRR